MGHDQSGGMTCKASPPHWLGASQGDLVRCRAVAKGSRLFSGAVRGGYPPARRARHRSAGPAGLLFAVAAAPVATPATALARRTPPTGQVDSELGDRLTSVQVTGRHCIISCYLISCYLAAVSCCCAFACDVSNDTNVPAAVALARKSNRPLLLAFLGTDWSIGKSLFILAASALGPCHHFHRQLGMMEG